MGKVNYIKKYLDNLKCNELSSKSLSLGSLNEKLYYIVAVHSNRFIESQYSKDEEGRMTPAQLKATIEGYKEKHGDSPLTWFTPLYKRYEVVYYRLRLDLKFDLDGELPYIQYLFSQCAPDVVAGTTISLPSPAYNLYWWVLKEDA